MQMKRGIFKGYVQIGHHRGEMIEAAARNYSKAAKPTISKLIFINLYGYPVSKL